MSRHVTLETTAALRQTAAEFAAGSCKRFTLNAAILASTDQVVRIKMNSGMHSDLLLKGRTDGVGYTPLSLHCRILPGPSGRHNLGNSLLDRRQGRICDVRFLLIPVGHRINVVGAEIGLTIFYGHSDRFVKADGRLQMPAVHREPRPWLFSGELDESNIWSGIERTEAP